MAVDHIQSELDSLFANTQDAIGAGEKAYLPFSLRHGELLTTHPDPAVREALARVARDGDRVIQERLLALHILAMRDDPAVDGILIEALQTPELRPTAAFLIGRIGFKGYPERQRDVEALLSALRPYLSDPTSYKDPWLDVEVRARDTATAAWIRLVGPETFELPPDSDFIGYELPSFLPAEHASLLAAIESSSKIRWQQE